LANRWQTKPGFLKVTTKTTKVASVREATEAFASLSVDDRLQAAEDWARRVLRDAGWPNYPGLHEVAPGKLAAPIALNPGSAEWFAVEVIRKADGVRYYRELGEMDNALMAMDAFVTTRRIAFEAGALSANVMQGRQVRSARSKGGKAPRRAELWSRIHELNSETTSRHSKVWRAEEIHKKLKADGCWTQIPEPDTIRRKLKPT